MNMNSKTSEGDSGTATVTPTGNVKSLIETELSMDSGFRKFLAIQQLHVLGGCGLCDDHQGGDEDCEKAGGSDDCEEAKEVACGG